MSLAEQLCSFINASPSPFHVVDTVAHRLGNAGFIRIAASDPWPTDPGRYVVIRGGSLIAVDTRGVSDPGAPFVILGGHTDSPTLRVKEHADASHLGVNTVLLEPYGSPILSSWFDRGLGISGRVFTRDGVQFLIAADEPVLTIPNLAIHLTNKTNAEGINPQKHLHAMFATGGDAIGRWVGEHIGVDESAIAGWELMVHDVPGAMLVGAHQEFVSSPRLDNQATCFAATEAMVAGPETTEHVRVLALFDHEEVGSGSERGAGSPFLSSVLERSVIARGGGREDLHQSLAGSFVVSADMAHATHPNYADKHEPNHLIHLGGGPVLKVNQNLRYATDAEGAARVQAACDAAGVPLQRYVHRADLPCGSTIGPIAASRTGILTVDVGAPMLAMHSAREFMSVKDLDSYQAMMSALLHS